MRGFIICLAAFLLGASATALLSQNIHDYSRGDEKFSGQSCKPDRLGDDPAICQDDERIQARELASHTTARAFPYVSSGTRMGQLGRYLETNGYVDGTGVCQGRNGYLILFLRDGKICDANKVEEHFPGRPNGPGGDNGGGGGGGGGSPGGDPRGGGVQQRGPGFDPRTGPISTGIRRNDGPCQPYYDMGSAAGRALAQANKARDEAACCIWRKRFNPQLACHPPAPTRATQRVPKVQPPPQQTAVTSPCQPKPANWNSVRIGQIMRARREALNDLAIARRAVVAWNGQTRLRAKVYFGSDTSLTRDVLLASITGAEGMLQRANAGNFFEGEPIRSKSGGPAVAYVEGRGPKNGDLQVFLTDEFWRSEADWKEHTLLHESFHHWGAGGADDLAYNPVNCATLALQETLDAGAAQMLGRPETLTRGLDNADSYAYFVLSVVDGLK